MININNKIWDNLRLLDIEKFLNSSCDDERFFIEFKEENIRNSQLAKEISAFSNSFGGYLFLGVDDNKKIVGCGSQWSELKINNIVCNCISPTPVIDIKKFKLKNSKKLYVIKVEEGKNTPYITNEGYIYHRVSSSSDRVKDSFTLNNLYSKSKENIKRIEEKIYISPIEGSLPDNLCGYIDMGFNLETKNINKINDILRKTDFEKISLLLKDNGNKYSVSMVGTSISISIGDVSLSNNDKQVLNPAGLHNFMEILSDGSFKCRVIIICEKNSSIANISQIIIMRDLFKKIYDIIFGDKLVNLFVEAKWYEKLTVVKIFQPKIIVNNEEKVLFDNLYNNHLIKYGNNMIINSNRIPLTGFFNIDSSLFKLNKMKFNKNELLNSLFYSGYNFLGYVDDFDSMDNES